MLEVAYPVETSKKLHISFKGSLCVDFLDDVWKSLVLKLDSLQPSEVIVDAQNISACDGAGIALLLDLKRHQQQRNSAYEIKGLQQQYSKLLEMVGDVRLKQPEEKKECCKQAVEDIGRFGYLCYLDWSQQMAFLGKFCVILFRLIRKPLSIRWRTVFFIAERAGADAVGITCLLGFLIGLILAFQAAIPMMRFGAQVFVADLVAVTLFRELGALITALVLASRSGSAFAAEIGTMKINEELDAMKTMGIDPLAFLVLPRVLAAVFVTPILTVFNIILGIVGAWLVMLSLGFSTLTFVNQVRGAVTLTDVAGGFVKTFIFGCLVAGIGCLRGLQTTSGATAVGEAATRAVVSSIIAVVLADGIFAIVFYYMGL